MNDKSRNIPLSRRHFIKATLGNLGFIILSSMGFSSLIKAADITPKRSNVNVVAMINLLRSIGSEVCVAAATDLESLVEGDSFSLHLRSAGLKLSEVQAMADTFNAEPEGLTCRVVSFSLSYNKEIGNKGALALAKALPLNLPELGLVGCDVGEIGGKAILQWANQTTGLRMICIEDNHFSNGLRTQFSALTQKFPGLYVSV